KNNFSINGDVYVTGHLDGYWLQIISLPNYPSVNTYLPAFGSTPTGSPARSPGWMGMYAY
ncbi:hypothetical protein SK128_007868, partial [Halocaridina rubra]